MKLSTLFVLGLMGSLGLSGCSHHPLLDDSTQNIQSFSLHKKIQIPADSARGYFQSGDYLGSAGFNQFNQHCRLEIRTLQSQPQTIQPDRFKVLSISTGEEAIAQASQPIQLAMLGNVNQQTLFYAMIGDHNRVETMDLIHLYLGSEKQPDILRLTCAGSLSNGSLFDDPYSHRPDKTAINKILGNYAKVE